MPPLLIVGYWAPNAFPRGHYDPDYWPHWFTGTPVLGDGGRGRLELMRWPFVEEIDDDGEVLVILA